MKNLLRFLGFLLITNYSLANDTTHYSFPLLVSSNLSMMLMDDFDMDGVIDSLDIDDDNDGILDAEESPLCFYTAEEVVDIVEITSDYSSPDNFDVLHDNETTRVFNFIGRTMNPGDDIFIIEYPTSVELSSIKVSERISNTATARARLYGSLDGVTWVELTSTDVALNITPTVFTVDSNNDRYKYYVIRNTVTGNIPQSYTIGEISSVVASSYLASRYPKPNCIDDLDNDGSPNHLDLDSDGDGCYDSCEAGVTGATRSGAFTDSLTIPVGQTTGVGLNGLADGVETSADSDKVNYTSNYQDAVNAQRNWCLDSDGDGVVDLVDIDDDNDGVLDVVEDFPCPKFPLDLPTSTGWIGTTCAPGAGGVGTDTELTLNPSTGQYYIYTNCDDISNGSNSIVFSGIEVGDEISITFEVYPGGTTNGRFLTGNSFLQNGATTEFELPFKIGRSQPSTGVGIFTVSFFAETTYFTLGLKNLRTGGIVSGIPYEDVSADVGIRFDLEATAAGSLECSELYDTDGDGIINSLDLDSDGDGCSDGIEACNTSLSDNDIINYNTGVDANGNGLLDEFEIGTTGTINYNSTYNFYALSDNLNVCADNDEDGIGDLVDIDDDNDGILDAVESPNCFYSPEELQMIVNVTSDLEQYSSFVITNSFDGNASTQAILKPAAWVGKTIYEITLGAAVAIDGIFVDVGLYKFSSNASSTFQLEGYNGSGWIPLSNPVVNNNTSDFTINNTLQPGIEYEKYRFVGVNGSAYYPSVREFSILIGDLISSRYPKSTCSDDLDDDGIPNHLDLDSDNDGIYDIVEAGNASVIALDIDGNGILEDTEFADTDMDGLSDDIENIISGDLTTNAGVTPVETTPGTPDYLNTDSDDDDCVDAIEAYNDVYVDSNGDGSYGGLLDPFNDMDPANINGVDGLGRVNAATYPGTNASVTDANISACVPDFRPELVLLNSIIIGESGNINFVVNIDELNNYSLDNGVPVQFTITKDTRVQINWNNSFVGAFNGNPFLQVDNTEWTYDGSNPFAHIWTYNVGGAFPANGLKKIGINAVYTVPATGVGTHSLNVIIPFANVGGESNFDNNIASDIINFDNN